MENKKSPGVISLTGFIVGIAGIIVSMVGIGKFTGNGVILGIPSSLSCFIWDLLLLLRVL